MSEVYTIRLSKEQQDKYNISENKDVKALIISLAHFKEKFLEFGEKKAIKIFKSKLTEDELKWLASL